MTAIAFRHDAYHPNGEIVLDLTGGKPVKKNIKIMCPDDIWKESLARVIESPFDAWGDSLWARKLSLQQSYSLLYMAHIKWGENKKLSSKLHAVPKKAQEFSKLQGSMLAELISVIAEVYAYAPTGFPTPAAWFMQVLLEAEVQGVSESVEYETSCNTATAIRERIAKQNSMLKNKVNPFVMPATKALFDRAIQLAGDRGRFRTQVYNRFIDARKKVSAYAKTPKAEFFHESNGIPLKARQGRSKLPTSKRVAT